MIALSLAPLLWPLPILLVVVVVVVLLLLLVLLAVPREAFAAGPTRGAVGEVVAGDTGESVLARFRLFLSIRASYSALPM